MFIPVFSTWYINPCLFSLCLVFTWKTPALYPGINRVCSLIPVMFSYSLFCPYLSLVSIIFIIYFLYYVPYYSYYFFLSWYSYLFHLYVNSLMCVFYFYHFFFHCNFVVCECIFVLFTVTVLDEGL